MSIAGAFIVGFPLAAVLDAKYGLRGPLFAAAAAGLLNFLVIVFLTPESLPRSARAAKLDLRSANPLGALRHIFGTSPLLRRCALGFGLAWLGNMCVNSQFGNYANHLFKWGPQESAPVLVLIGLMIGLAPPALIPRLGLKRSILAGGAVYSAGLLAIAFARTPGALARATVARGAQPLARTLLFTRTRRSLTRSHDGTLPRSHRPHSHSHAATATQPQPGSRRPRSHSPRSHSHAAAVPSKRSCGPDCATEVGAPLPFTHPSTPHHTPFTLNLARSSSIHTPMHNTFTLSWALLVHSHTHPHPIHTPFTFNLARSSSIHTPMHNTFTLRWALLFHSRTFHPHSGGHGPLHGDRLHRHPRAHLIHGRAGVQHCGPEGAGKNGAGRGRESEGGGQGGQREGVGGRGEGVGGRGYGGSRGVGRGPRRSQRAESAC